MSISRTIDETSKVTLLYTDASNTLSVGGGNSMSFTAVVISRKGKPGVVHKLNADNWELALGKPFHMREGIHAEGMRHLGEAVTGGVGSVVRVMPSNAAYPILTIGAESGGKNAVAKRTAAYGAEPVLTGDESIAIYMIDGDNENERSITIEAASTDEYGAGFYVLSLTETNKDGVVTELESHVVSLEIGAVGVNNQTAFIEDKLVAVSPRLRAITDVSKLNTFTAIDEATFEGGTSGDYSTITADDYKAAIALIKAEKVKFQAVISAGCYDDAVLKELKALADSNNVSLYYDVEPNLSFAQAVTRQVSLTMNSEFACAYHFPYLASDPYYGGQALWGLSGFVFAAKAKGVSLKAPTGGWHYTPAGESRATISTRSNMVLHANAGECDEVAFVNARLNKLGLNSAGQVMIDDALTTRARKDDLRFENTASVSNAIGRDFVELATTLKHSPDDDTLKGLNKGLTRIFDGYVSSGCLVPPSDPVNGASPYTFEIKQVESDLWEVSWSISVSGSARRFVGKPKLF
ncbi:hypothetical protein [Aliivibrio salmonicida]|uniref:hypothetical protein n=1 Tax=Aliivibrio salmonicida TaxID=40269 RepID=UPI003D102E3A